jgi:hypothetical protein
MSLRDHLIAAALAAAVMAISLMTGRAPEVAEAPSAPVEVAEAPAPKARTAV